MDRHLGSVAAETAGERRTLWGWIKGRWEGQSSGVRASCSVWLILETSISMNVSIKPAVLFAIAANIFFHEEFHEIDYFRDRHH